MKNQKKAERERELETARRSVRQRTLGRHSVIDLLVGTLMIVIYPKTAGFLLGGVLIIAGLVFGVMYLRSRLG